MALDRNVLNDLNTDPGDVSKTLDDACGTSCMTLQGRTVTKATMTRMERLRPVNMLIFIAAIAVEMGAARHAPRAAA